MDREATRGLVARSQGERWIEKGRGGLEGEGACQTLGTGLHRAQPTVVNEFSINFHGILFRSSSYIEETSNKMKELVLLGVT